MITVKKQYARLFAILLVGLPPIMSTSTATVSQTLGGEGKEKVEEVAKPKEESPFFSLKQKKLILGGQC